MSLFPIKLELFCVQYRNKLLPFFFILLLVSRVYVVHFVCLLPGGGVM